MQQVASQGEEEKSGIGMMLLLSIGIFLIESLSGGRRERVISTIRPLLCCVSNESQHKIEVELTRLPELRRRYKKDWKKG